jgi:DNA-binding NtrC family response regulator
MKQGIKILVVDDEELIRWSLQTALAALGPSVDVACCAEEAIELLEKSDYDLVITDYMLPGLSGLELLEIVQEKKARPLVILISAYLSPEAIEQANEYGAFKCVDKPFGMDDILGVVREAVEKRIA